MSLSVKSWMLMKPCTRTLLSLSSLLFLTACVDKKDLNPPPLNPHPKEALHVTVSFDRPEDAKRYAIEMKALYQNQQRECGYVDPWHGGAFFYPEGNFPIPASESTQPGNFHYSVYMDRYDRAVCNWELAHPYFTVWDTYTKRWAFGDWGSKEHLAPGAEYKLVCQFRADEFPQSCYHDEPIPDIAHYSRIPITVRVSGDSAPLRPKLPSYYSAENFLKPMSQNP